MLNGLIKKINYIFIITLLSSLSFNSLAQDYANYNTQEVQLVTKADLLKTNDSTLPSQVSGKDNVTLSVFFDYNCHASRELLKILDQKYTKNPTSNLKIIYRPMDYGFNSKEVLQAVLYVKNLQPSKFNDIHQEILKIDSPITLAQIQQIAAKINIDFRGIMNGMSGPTIQQEMDKNKQDFEALPYPAKLAPAYKNALPVIIVANSGKLSKLIYFIGSDQNNLDTAITNIRA